jgi:osmotically-inducible protein OsmY
LKRMRFFGSMALGAGLMYLLDPKAGRRRRALLRDQFVHAGHELGDTAEGKSRYAKDRAYGAMSEARSMIKDEQVDDRTLEDRVRSALGRVASRMGTIHVTAADGRVTLHGSAPSEEMEEILDTTESVRGVTSVDNRLEADQGARKTG